MLVNGRERLHPKAKETVVYPTIETTPGTYQLLVKRWQKVNQVAREGVNREGLHWLIRQTRQKEKTKKGLPLSKRKSEVPLDPLYGKGVCL